MGPVAICICVARICGKIGLVYDPIFSGCVFEVIVAVDTAIDHGHSNSRTVVTEAPRVRSIDSGARIAKKRL
jgi:hypothetical protein